MTKDEFISAEVLYKARLPEVEPIPAECGPFALIGDDFTLGVMRQPSGRVKMLRLSGSKTDLVWHLSPEEAKWLREALEKIGY